MSYIQPHVIFWDRISSLNQGLTYLASLAFYMVLGISGPQDFKADFTNKSISLDPLDSNI